MTDLSNLTEQQKDDIIRKAIQVIHWSGWLTSHCSNPSATAAVAELKETTEGHIGGEFEVYT